MESLWLHSQKMGEKQSLRPLEQRKFEGEVGCAQLLFRLIKRVAEELPIL